MASEFSHYPNITHLSLKVFAHLVLDLRFLHPIIDLKCLQLSQVKEEHAHVLRQVIPIIENLCSI